MFCLCFFSSHASKQHAAPLDSQRIQFALSKSDVIAKMDGTYVPKNKRAAAMDEDQQPPVKRPVAGVLFCSLSLSLSLSL